MVEYVVNKLTKKFNISRKEAALFFYEVYKINKINDLIVSLDMFETFQELKDYFLGGKTNEL